MHNIQFPRLHSLLPLVLLPSLYFASSCKERSKAKVLELSLHTDRYEGFVVDVPLLIPVTTESGDNITNESDFLEVIRVNRKNVEEFTANPANISASGFYKIQDGPMDDYRNEILQQIKFALLALEKSNAYAAFKKMEISSIKFPDQKFLEGDEQQNGKILMVWSARIPLQVDKGITFALNQDITLPKTTETEFLKKTITEYTACVSEDHRTDVTPEKFFGNFDKSLCNFDAINSSKQRFISHKFNVQSPQPKNKGESPEYHRIWEDGVMNVSMFFGKHTDKAKSDPGTDAFQQTVKKITADKEFKVISNQKNSKNSVHLKLEYIGSKRPSGLSHIKGPLQIDIMLVHSSNISNIPNEETATLIFGDRLQKSDFFMYNGHAGYGSNVTHLEKILNLEQGQYMMLHVNGCYTYSYSSSENPNLDIIVNARPSYFGEMGTTSYDTFKGLIHGDTYLQLLNHSPEHNRAIMIGDDIKSVPAKK